MTQDEINQQAWENDKNWRMGTFYRSRRDSRLIIPKARNSGWGWTINFGHRRALLLVYAIILVSTALGIAANQVLGG